MAEAIYNKRVSYSVPLHLGYRAPDSSMAGHNISKNHAGPNPVTFAAKARQWPQHRHSLGMGAVAKIGPSVGCNFTKRQSTAMSSLTSQASGKLGISNKNSPG